MITFTDCGREFSGRWAVRGLDLVVNSGEIFGLLGPNGAGKTTTIKMMTGLIRPSTGSVSLDGFDIAREPVRAKAAFGYLPDRSFLYEKITPLEFLRFIYTIYRLDKAKMDESVTHMLQTVGLSGHSNKLIEELSHGTRQRLLFASAIIHDPKILIIDEPFTGLDPYGVNMMKDMLRSLAASGKTIFLATHSLHIAEELCHRAGIIDAGRLVCVINREVFAKEKGGLADQFMSYTT